ncbi:hypothetical protein LTR29_008984 [Friedmanniomyces endolithicus]|nr:hypothetical protein LTR29_008984 [Friedmanniomyces endolithicus]
MFYSIGILAPLAALSIGVSYACVLYLLTYKRSLQAPYTNDSRDLEELKVLQRVVQALTVVSAVAMLSLPHYPKITATDPFLQSGLRVLCFFYACKLLDLGLTKVEKPPTRLTRKERPDDDSERQPAPMQTFRDWTVYSWLLLTEMRYRSFDIAVKQKGRPQNIPEATLDRKQHLLWTAGPPILLPALVFLLPSHATKCALLLLVIQSGLEGIHTVLHRQCPEPVFFRPFSAASLSDFWSTNWHAGATSFLQSLAYKPTLRITGSRPAAVLTAFSLTGIWHGWAVAPVSKRPWVLGLQVTALFVGFGVGCLVERWIWGKKQGGSVQRVCVWAYSLIGAGICERTLECSCRYDWLRQDCK